MTLVTLAISITANFLLFIWILWILLRHHLQKTALLRGTLIAALGFEIIKFVMTMMLPHLTSFPSGAVCGPVLGLIAFFYFFVRLTSLCSAWIATAQYLNNTIESDNYQRISNTD